jgi:hypothetical protein
MKTEYAPPNRYVEVRYWWIRNILRIGEAAVEYVEPNQMQVDGFTKGLNKINLWRNLVWQSKNGTVSCPRSNVGVRSQYLILGAYDCAFRTALT